MTTINYGTEEAPRWFITITISIEGKEREIIPAFTGCSIKRKDFSKDKIFAEIDKTKLLPTVFCFADAQVFINESEALYDYVGNELSDMPDNAPPIMVYLDKSDNINLFDLIKTPLPSILVQCDSVSDAYNKVAISAYLSKVPDKNEWIGLACIVSKDTVLQSIRKFSNNFFVAGTTAQGYFGVTTTTAFLQSKALTNDSSSILNGQCRTYSQAEKLLEAAVNAFGVRDAKQTRHIKAINYCIQEYGMELILEALGCIGATDKLKLEVAKCEDRVQCLQCIIIEQVLKLGQRKSA